MPCYDNRESYRTDEAMANRVTELTRTLCETVEHLRKNKIELPTRLRLWANAHDRVDAERKAQEQSEAREKRRKARALAKLTDSERELLGL